MTFLRFSLLWLFLVSTGLSASTESITVNSFGIGATEEMAVQKALSEAIIKATGATVSSTFQSDSLSVRATNNENNGIVVSKSSSNKISTKGNIKSYEVKSINKMNDGLWKAELTVEVFSYNLPESSNRKRIALMPVKLHQRQYELYKVYPAAQVRDLVANAVERYLVQSRKFAVLSRSDLAAMGAEMALINSDATPAAEKARLGQMLGSDYILLPELVSGEATYTERRIQVTGQVKSWYEGNVSLLMRVIATATGEVKFSEKYSVPSNDFNSAEDVLAFVASIGVDDLVQRIYPNRIVSASGSEVVINAGGNTLREGMRFNVFSEGESLVDPYTGESLGAREVQVGEVVITKVEAKMSYAKIISGDNISEGHILRENLNVPVVQPKPVQKIEKGFKAPWE